MSHSHRRRHALVCSLFALLALGSSCSTERDGDPGALGTSAIAPSGRATGFVFIGDFGTGDEDEEALSSAIRAWVRSRPFDALVTLGDNVYDDGSPSRFDAAWTDPFGWVSDAGVPVIASLGNHDVQTADGAPVMGLFDMPGRWYERTVGPASFFVLDANDNLTHGGQMEWLSDELASSSAAWQILVFHHPMFSCGQHGSTPRVQRQLPPAIDGHGVDLVVNGHDHDYQRFPPVDGTTYIVSGGGAASLYPVGGCPSDTPEPVAWNDDVHQFLYVSATDNELVGTAVPVEGRPLDTFRLTQSMSGT
jgi:3',5'-cyclic AMP phosphodiesterase CpdA